MGFYVVETHNYVCDRCGEHREVDRGPWPPGWMQMRLGLPTSICDPNGPSTLLCVDCVSWLRKFLEGRKVAD
jgi:hypothetical protein